jgi:hypothetical protein
LFPGWVTGAAIVIPNGSFCVTTKSGHKFLSFSDLSSSVETSVALLSSQLRIIEFRSDQLGVRHELIAVIENIDQFLFSAQSERYVVREVDKLAWLCGSPGLRKENYHFSAGKFLPLLTIEVSYQR